SPAREEDRGGMEVAAGMIARSGAGSGRQPPWMNDKMRKAPLLIAAMFLVAPALAAQNISYPKGYQAWQHVKSMVINKSHPLFELVGGIHHISASPKAIKGYKAGEFPDGAVIVLDLFEAKELDNAIVEGSHKAIMVMEKSPKRFAQTGRWGF